MKEFNSDYIYEKALNENLSDFFKGIWNWLIGKDIDKEYDITADEYDEVKHKKVISKYDASHIDIMKLDNDKLSQIIKIKTPHGSEISAFNKTQRFVEKEGANDINKFCAFMFSCSEIKGDAAGIICYSLSNGFDIKSLDILKVYNDILTPKTIVEVLTDYVHKLDLNKIRFIKPEKSFIKKIKEYKSINLSDDGKDTYTIYV